MKLRIDRTWDGRPVEDGATVALSDAGEALRIEVCAPWRGDPPPAGPPGPTDRLWEHEVVELFVVGAGDRYTEVELGPHGHHLVLRLEGVRNPVASMLPLDYRVQRQGDRWRGTALLSRDLLPPGPHRVNAFAIHGVGAARRYLAAFAVDGQEADFHRIDRFPAVELP